MRGQPFCRGNQPGGILDPDSMLMFMDVYDVDGVYDLASTTAGHGRSYVAGVDGEEARSDEWQTASGLFDPIAHPTAPHTVLSSNGLLPTRSRPGLERQGIRMCCCQGFRGRYALR